MVAADLVVLCRYLRMFEGPIPQEVDAMIAATGDGQSTRDVRDFKSKIDAVTLAYEPLAEQMREAAKLDASTFPQFVLRDAAKAEMHANALYSWARTFFPKDTSTHVDASKMDKLRMMPYVVAMAYAVRVKLDVHYIEGSATSAAERPEYFKRSRDIVDRFMAVVGMAVRSMLSDSSLLDVALDYHFALETYIALMTALQASLQAILKPKDAPGTIALWDDGLSQLR